MLLFHAEDVAEAAIQRPPGRPPGPEPIEVLAEKTTLVEVPPPLALPTGLATLQRIGRFEPAPWGGRSLGGAELLGKVRFGADWLRVYRSWSGVVYHEQAEWMDEDPDWCDRPEHAETYCLLEAAA